MIPEKPIQCPKCKRDVVEISHFHEPDHLGIQGVIHHKKTPVTDMFGGTHISYSDNCYLTEQEYQEMVK